MGGEGPSLRKQQVQRGLDFLSLLGCQTLEYRDTALGLLAPYPAVHDSQPHL